MCVVRDVVSTLEHKVTRHLLAIHSDSSLCRKFGIDVHNENYHTKQVIGKQVWFLLQLL